MGGECWASAQEHECKYAECNEMFRSRWQRCYHYKLAHHEVQLQCPECGTAFTKLQHLEVHLRSHLKIKPYRCKYEGCNETFLTQQHRRNHTYTHTGEKLFECTVCKKAFREQSTLKRHTRTHTNVKPYKCEVCQKSFSYASSRNIHRKQFHGPHQIVHKAGDRTSKDSNKGGDAKDMTLPADPATLPADPATLPAATLPADHATLPADPDTSEQETAAEGTVK